MNNLIPIIEQSLNTILEETKKQIIIFNERQNRMEGMINQLSNKFAEMEGKFYKIEKENSDIKTKIKMNHVLFENRLNEESNKVIGIIQDHNYNQNNISNIRNSNQINYIVL